LSKQNVTDEQKINDEHTVDDEINQVKTNQGEEEEATQGTEEPVAEPEIIVEEDTEDTSIDELKTKLTAAEQKAEEHYQKYLRAQADFDNFRRRTQKEKENQANYASLSVIEQLLPALDNFERALTASKGTQDAESLSKGVEMVFRQMEQVLSSEGLEVIPTVGEAFDPTVHQAVMQEESDEFESGTVIAELQKGYKLKDKVVRPAMVKVSS
jgi:molecular chaperone GrpE